MTSSRLILLGIVLLAPGCGSKGGSSTPLAPTVTPPAGCSGGAVERVEVSFSVSGQNAGGINIEVFGKTFNQQIAVGQRVTVTEDVVPCNYEITGQMLGPNLSVGFGRTPPFSGSFSASEGVEKGSVVIVDGPNGAVSSSGNCRVDYSVPVMGALPPPSNIKILFRVSKTNAISGMGGGCS